MTMTQQLQVPPNNFLAKTETMDIKDIYHMQTSSGHDKKAKRGSLLEKKLRKGSRKKKQEAGSTGSSSISSASSASISISSQSTQSRMGDAPAGKELLAQLNSSMTSVEDEGLLFAPPTPKAPKNALGREKNVEPEGRGLSPRSKIANLLSDKNPTPAAAEKTASTRSTMKDTSDDTSTTSPLSTSAMDHSGSPKSTRKKEAAALEENSGSETGRRMDSSSRVSLRERRGRPSSLEDTSEAGGSGRRSHGTDKTILEDESKSNMGASSRRRRNHSMEDNSTNSSNGVSISARRKSSDKTPPSTRRAGRAKKMDNTSAPDHGSYSTRRQAAASTMDVSCSDPHHVRGPGNRRLDDPMMPPRAKSQDELPTPSLPRRMPPKSKSHDGKETELVTRKHRRSREEAQMAASEQNHGSRRSQTETSEDVDDVPVLKADRDGKERRNRHRSPRRTVTEPAPKPTTEETTNTKDQVPGLRRANTTTSASEAKKDRKERRYSAMPVPTKKTHQGILFFTTTQTDEKTDTRRTTVKGRVLPPPPPPPAYAPPVATKKKEEGNSNDSPSPKKDSGIARRRHTTTDEPPKLHHFKNDLA